MKNYIKKLISGFVSEPLKDAIEGKIPGNSYNSWPSHFYREILNSNIETCLKNDALNKINLFAESQSKASDQWAPIPPDFSDIINLICLATYFNCESALEYGSGCSTAGFVAWATEKNRKRNFESIDSSEYWAEINNNAIGNSFIGLERSFIRYASSKIINFRNYTSYIHESCPDIKKADFIYVDGPPLKEANLALDVIYYQLYSENTVIVLDGRGTNAAGITKLLQEDDNNWESHSFRFPSNDTIILNKKNNLYSKFMEDYKAFLS